MKNIASLKHCIVKKTEHRPPLPPFSSRTTSSTLRLCTKYKGRSRATIPSHSCSCLSFKAAPYLAIQFCPLDRDEHFVHSLRSKCLQTLSSNYSHQIERDFASLYLWNTHQYNSSTQTVVIVQCPQYYQIFEIYSEFHINGELMNQTRSDTSSVLTEINVDNGLRWTFLSLVALLLPFEETSSVLTEINSDNGLDGYFYF